MSNTDILSRFVDTMSLVSVLEREHEYETARSFSDKIVSEVLAEVYDENRIPKLFEYECTMCGEVKPDVTIRTRNTMYICDIHNYHLVCSQCNDIDFEELEEMWAEVNSDIRTGLR